MAKDEADADEKLREKEAAEKKAEALRQKIADSKKNYRSPSDLMKQRWTEVDYSCVSATGSPCPPESAGSSSNNGQLEDL